MSQTLVVVPARMASTRLPGKPLVEIGGAPMIVQVWRRAIEASIGRVVVACAEEAIAAAVREAGGEAVLTDPELPSGTDRVRAALDAIDAERRYRRIVNLQGDMPTIAPATIAAALAPEDCDIATLAAPSDDPAERADPNLVKAVVAGASAPGEVGRALYFTRAPAPSGPGPILHHIGIYAFERDALDRFAGLAPTPLERRERLEQLRALENGMTIGVAIVADAPLGVDAPEDLARARAVFAAGA